MKDYSPLEPPRLPGPVPPTRMPSAWPFWLLGLLALVGYWDLRAYLWAYLFWLELSLGSLVWLLLHRLTGGVWGLPLLPYLRRGARQLGLLALLFVPLAIGYPWIHEGVEGHMALYLTPAFLLSRAGVYFIVWTALAWRIRGGGEGLAAGGLMGVLFTGSFAAIDWILSFQPHFTSTAFGIIWLVTATLGALAFAVLALVLQRRQLTEFVTPKLSYDLGSLLFTLVVLRSYVAFGQFLIVYNGDLPSEISWYPGWTRTVWTLWLGGLALPFGLLLSPRLKRTPVMLGVVSSLILAGQAGLGYCQVMGGLDPLATLAWLGVGGLWMGGWLWK